MYKDKEKQKEANRVAQARFKASKKVLPNQGITEGITGKVLPANFGQSNCQCRHCRANEANGLRLTINHGQYKPVSQLGPKEVNRVAKPGDADYELLEAWAVRDRLRKERSWIDQDAPG